MMKPQKRKYRVFARDLDKKPKIEEFDNMKEVEQFMEEEEWITISIEMNLEKVSGSKLKRKK